MNRIDISKISIANSNFWNAFFSGSYPNGYDEELDLSVSDITSEFADMDWWDDFTGYDEVEQVLANENGEILFWLLLPLAKISANNVDEVVVKLEKMLESLFETAVCKDIARCLVNQLVEE